MYLRGDFLDTDVHEVLVDGGDLFLLGLGVVELVFVSDEFGLLDDGALFDEVQGT